MDINAVISQIKTYCPTFNTVAGSADVESIEDRTAIALPAAFVNYLSMDAEDAEGQQNTYYQVARETFEVIIVLDNRTDNRGQTAITYTVNSLQSELMSALLFWRLDTVNSSKPLYIRGGHFIKMDRARLYYRFVFENQIQLTYADGFQITGVSLTEIDLTANSIDLQQNSTTFPIYIQQG